MVDTRMEEKFLCFNIRDLLEDDIQDENGESELQKALSDFSSPKNADVERFLRKNAIEFTKKDQSITYLVFSGETMEMVGYFAITVKPVTISAEGFSKNEMRKMNRVGNLDIEHNSYTVAAYLIAQLGKNYHEDIKALISGMELMEIAVRKLHEIQYQLGGLVVYLECEDKQVLLDFYMKNGFKVFSKRVVDSATHEEPYELVQLMSFL